MGIFTDFLNGYKGTKGETKKEKAEITLMTTFSAWIITSLKNIKIKTEEGEDNDG